jgi:hypothetical protein
MKSKICLLLACCAAILTAAPASAHELQSNRATLVLRDNNHLSLNLYLDYCALLQRTLAPKSNEREFVLRYAAIPPQALRSALQQAQTKLEQEIQLSAPNQQAMSFTHWQWPDLKSVQHMLQQQAMQNMVAPHVHPHDAQLEIRAEASTSMPINQIRLQLPAAMQPLLLVSYRPSQQWLNSGNSSSEIRF